MRPSARLLWSIALVCLAAVPAAAANPFPRAGSSYLVKSGDTAIWSHRANLRRPPASLTKIMTALLVIERGGLEEVVTVSPEAAAETGSRLRLRAGEQFLVADLLAATLLKSANDAAHALADHEAGSEAQFVVLMNRRAVELGLKNTHFANCCGFDHPKHYSTADDIARLTEFALSLETFREIVGRAKFDIQTIGGERTFHLKNTNRLLGQYDGMVGGKTGFTSKAGPCLVAVAERGEARVLVVLLNSRARWSAAPTILDRAFKGPLSRSSQVARLADPPSSVH